MKMKAVGQGAVLFLLVVLQACTAPVRRPDRGPVPGDIQPLISVGLMQNQNVIRFMVSGRFSIFDASGKFIARGLKGYSWQAQVLERREAAVEYRLRYATVSSPGEAEKKLYELSRLGLRAEVQPRRQEKVSFASNRGQAYDVVLWEIFPSQNAAEKRSRELAPRVHVHVFERVLKPAGGAILISSQETRKTFRVPDGARIVTERFALFDVPVGEGYHWENREDRVYRGSLVFLITSSKKLTAVNLVPLEDYIRGVVPSEMRYDFPLEALKAQAIAARGQVLARLGEKHAGDGFDICATVHCQVYSGLSRETESTNRAVDETAALVMRVNGELAEMAYSGNCGGHTENNEAVWNGAPKSHLRGRFDGRGAADLIGTALQDDPQVLRRWVNTRPKLFCNTIDRDIPDALGYTRKYFRWQQAVSRTELEKYIEQATGERIGTLYDLIPLERGVSGRISSLKIVGSAGTVIVERELNVRKALSPTTLYSACIVIDKETGADGIPQRFIFTGAGWGHGVGMCQTGAAVMALEGYTSTEILQHYYSGVELSRAY